MKIPRYWCPRCENFKKIYQVAGDDYTGKPFCRHCGEELIELESWMYAQAKEHFKPRSCKVCSWRRAAEMPPDVKAQILKDCDEAVDQLCRRMDGKENTDDRND